MFFVFLLCYETALIIHVKKWLLLSVQYYIQYMIYVLYSTIIS